MENQNNFKLDLLNVIVQNQAVSFTINHLRDLKYTEDIGKASVDVEITLTDSQTGVLSNMFGMENAVLQFSDTKGNTIAVSLVVYEIKNRDVVDGKQTTATLRCCNPDITASAGILISTQFENKNISDIVSDLLKKVLITRIPIIESDKAVNNITFVTNYWTPINIIKWLADKAIYSSKSGKSATAGFLFYQNKEGYNWRGMDSLVKDEPRFEFVCGVDLTDKQREAGDVIEVDNISVKETSNILKGFNYGSYTSKVTVFDIGTQSVQDFDFNAYNLYKDIPKLNSGELPESYANMDKKPTRIMTKVMNSKLFNAGEYTKDLTKILSQASFRNTMFFNKSVEVQYVGDFQLKVGDVVTLKNYIGRERKLDTVNSGKYIVGKIQRHYISATSSMSTKVTLYNDSLGTDQDARTSSLLSPLVK